MARREISPSIPARACKNYYPPAPVNWRLRAHRDFRRRLPGRCAALDASYRTCRQLREETKPRLRKHQSAVQTRSPRRARTNRSQATSPPPSIDCPARRLSHQASGTTPRNPAYDRCWAASALQDLRLPFRPNIAKHLSTIFRPNYTPTLQPSPASLQASSNGTFTACTPGA